MKAFSDVLIVLIGLGFGVSIKIADMVVDDGLHWFRYDGYLFGILWGLLGGCIVYLDRSTGAVYVALLSYWLIRGKLDHLIHRIGGALLMLVALLQDLSSHSLVIIVLLLFYESSYYVKKTFFALDCRNKLIHSFFRYRIQFLLAPLGLSLAMSDVKPFLVVMANMIGVALAYHMFQKQLTRSGL